MTNRDPMQIPTPFLLAQQIINALYAQDKKKIRWNRISLTKIPSTTRICTTSSDPPPPMKSHVLHCMRVKLSIACIITGSILCVIELYVYLFCWSCLVTYVKLLLFLKLGCLGAFINLDLRAIFLGWRSNLTHYWFQKMSLACAEKEKRKERWNWGKKAWIE